MKPRIKSITLPSPVSRRGLGPISNESNLELDCDQPPRVEHHERVRAVFERMSLAERAGNALPWRMQP